jgi:hypothetical protein
MNRNMISYSCRECGHMGSKHVYMDSIMDKWSHIMVCGDCNPILEHPHEFVLDNLKYLEECYARSKM